MADLMAALEEALGVPDRDRLYGVGPPVISTVPQPAPGANFTFTLPANRSARLLAVCATFTASAAVANRVATFNLVGPNGAKLYDISDATARAAGAGIVYSLAAGIGLGYNAGGRMVLALPEVWLPPGCSFINNTGLIDAGDQWSNIAYLAQYR